MVEPLNIATSITSCTQLVEDLALAFQDSIGTLKEVPNGAQELMDGLNSVLRVLTAFPIQDLPTSPRPREAELVRGLRSLTKEGQIFLERLNSGPKRQKRLFSRRKWPFKEKEIIDMISRIKNLTGFMVLVMNLYVQIQLNTEDSSFAKTISLGGAGAHEIEEEEWQKVLNWIYPDAFDKTHLEVSRRRKGTDQWLFRTPEIINWIENGGILWGYGILGAGKTFVVSSIIDHLQFKEGSGVAYIYFSRINQKQQTPNNVLRSLIKQLGAQMIILPQELKDLYISLRLELELLALTDLYSVLIRFSKSFAQTFFVFDALDECDARSQRRDLLPLFHRMHSDGISVFITSRQHPEDIQNSFKHSEKLQISATSESIESYIIEKIEENPQAKGLIEQGGYKERIISELTDRSRGMFLIVHFEIEYLFQKTTSHQLSRALEELKHSGGKFLDPIYSRAIEELRSQARSCIEAAYRILSWLSKAQRVLSTRELQLATSVEEGEPLFDEYDLLDQITILDLCASFVEAKENAIQLIHYTVKDFLIRNEIIPESADLQIAMTCITFISLDIFAEGSCSSDIALENRLKSYPFLEYAAQELAFHLRQCDESLTAEIVLKFIGQPGNISSYLQALYLKESTNKDSERYNRYPRGLTQLHLVAVIGHCSVARSLLERGDDIMAIDERGWTPLHYAVFEGNGSVVTMLLDHGAMIDSPDKAGQTPLHYAALKGDGPVIRLLVERGPDILGIDKIGRTPLHCLATVWYSFGEYQLEEHELAAQLLIEQSTEALSIDKRGQTLLHDTISKIILVDDGRSPGSHCAIDPRRKSVQPQDGENLDILAPSNEKKSLECSVMVCYKPLVSLLLDEGININAADCSGKRVLHYIAIGRYCEPLALFLLEKGAEISALDHDGRTPLHHAVIRGCEPLVLLLIKKGADILIADNNGQTPLHHATIEGYEPLVLLLLNSGADVLAFDDNGRTPLHHAAAKGYKPLISVLLEHGADILAADKDGQTPLHYAATGGYQPLVSLLLEKGSDISAIDHMGYTAVNKAANGGYALVVRLLLEMGGDFSVEGLEERTALCLAMALSNLERYGESLGLFKQVLESQEKRLGIERLDTADTAQKIVHALSHLGRYEETLGLFKQILNSQEKNLGKEHVNTITTHNMACALSRIHRYEEAVLLYTKVLASRETILGQEHPDTLTTAQRMADTLTSLGRYEESVILNMRVLNSRQKVLGYEHRDSLDTAHNLAQTLTYLKRYKEALELYTSVLLSRKKVLGEEHVDTLATSHEIAWVQYMNGDYEIALGLYKKVLASRKTVLGEEHLDTLDTASGIAQTLNCLGEYEDALELYEQVFESRRKTLGTEHLDTLATSHNLAGTLVRLRRYIDAIEFYDYVLPNRRRILGEEHQNTLETIQDMAHALSHVRRYPESLGLYKCLLENQEKNLGKENPTTLRTVQSMASVCELMGWLEQALGLYRDVLVSREKVLGKEHPDTLNTYHKVTSITQELHNDEGVLSTLEASSSKDDIIREPQISEEFLCVQGGGLGEYCKNVQNMVTTPARSNSHIIRDQETFRSFQQTLVMQGNLPQGERLKTLEPISETIPVPKEPRVQSVPPMPPRCNEKNTIDIISFLRRQAKRFEDASWKIKYKISALEFLIIRELELHRVDKDFPTRVHWKCSCGAKLFDDFREFNGDRPASQYVLSLNQRSKNFSDAESMFCLPDFVSFPTQAALGGYHPPEMSTLMQIILEGLGLPEFPFFLIRMVWGGGNSHIGAPTDLTNPGGQISHPPHSTQGGTTNPALTPPIHLTQVGSSSHHPQQGGASNPYLPAVQPPNAIRNRPSPAQLTPTPGSIDHLLLCFNDGSVNFQNFQLAPSTCDQQIFMEIREEYYKQRGWWRSQFSFEVLKRVEFVKFEVYYQNLVEIRARCELPPTSNTEYKYLPKPAEMIPPVPGFMYFFHKPECAPTSDELLTKMPKRVSALRDLGCGWGIHFIEEPCMFRIYMLAVFIVVVDSIFAVVWSVVMKDIQGGFGVAAFITSVGAIFIAIGWRQVSS